MDIPSALIFIFIFSTIFITSLLAIFRFQNKGYFTIPDIIKAILLSTKRIFIIYITAFILGFAAGFRGSQELEKPWNQPNVCITELDNPEAGDTGKKE